MLLKQIVFVIVVLNMKRSSINSHKQNDTNVHLSISSLSFAEIASTCQEPQYKMLFNIARGHLSFETHFKVYTQIPGTS